MGYLQDEKVTTNVISNEKEVIHILDHELKNDNPSFTSSEETSDIEGYVPDLQWTEEEEKKILRAIDIKLMPFVLLMNFVLNMDRTNNSNAISDNLPLNLGFGITEVNTATLVYSLVFTIIAFITTPIAKYFGSYRWMVWLMSAWAIVTWSYAFLKDFKGYLLVRFFIAFTEAGFIPACLLYLNTWYKSTELATRLTWFWAIQWLASAFSGLISFGIFDLSGVGGLYGWQWLFIIDGIFTHVIGLVAFFYIPVGPFKTSGYLRGKNGWFTEREANIAVTRIIRDDLFKSGQNKKLTWHDIKITVLDTKLWTHLMITFLSMMPNTPVNTYLPTLIKEFGFPVTTSNLLTVPPFIISLIVSIFVAQSADKRGSYGIHAIFGCIWSMAGFLALEFMSGNSGRWSFYVAALFISSTPSFHGLHIAWMSTNTAPNGKRTIAIGTIIGFANLCGIPGSQIYQQNDSPRFYKGNWINFGLMAVSALLLAIQHVRYALTNKYREKKWNSLSDSEKKEYDANTKDEGSNRLDYRFRV